MMTNDVTVDTDAEHGRSISTLASPTSLTSITTDVHKSIENELVDTGKEREKERERERGKKWLLFEGEMDNVWSR